jgi:hypothetical protein
MGARIAAAVALTIGALGMGLPGIAVAPSDADPIYHGTLGIRPIGGTLGIRPAGGTIVRRDRDGTGTLKVPHWRLVLTPDSNGVFPDQEVVSVGIETETLSLAPGALRPSAHGKVFSYRAPRPFLGRGIRSFRLWRTRDRAYAVRFTVGGFDLSTLLDHDPICRSLAVIIGDDDGFAVVLFTSPSFDSTHFAVWPDFPVLPAGTFCTGKSSWPWLGS